MKNYLFASVTSTLLLLIVVPLLSATHSITEAVSIATLSLVSVSVGGLVAETFAIVTARGSSPKSQRNAKTYFMSLVCSLLFITIVAPSLTLALDSSKVANQATASALLALSVGIGGAATDGFFTLFSKTNLVANNHSTSQTGKHQHSHTTAENGLVDVLLGRAKVGGK